MNMGRTTTATSVLISCPRSETLRSAWLNRTQHVYPSSLRRLKSGRWAFFRRLALFSPAAVPDRCSRCCDFADARPIIFRSFGARVRTATADLLQDTQQRAPRDDSFVDRRRAQASGASRHLYRSMENEPARRHCRVPARRPAEAVRSTQGEIRRCARRGRRAPIGPTLRRANLSIPRRRARPDDAHPGGRHHRVVEAIFRIRQSGSGGAITYLERVVGRNPRATRRPPGISSVLSQSISPALSAALRWLSEPGVLSIGGRWLICALGSHPTTKTLQPKNTSFR